MQVTARFLRRHHRLMRLTTLALVSCLFFGCTAPVVPMQDQPQDQTRQTASPERAVEAQAVGASSVSSEKIFPSGAHGNRVAGLLTYTSKPWGFDTNSYFLEGPDGLVMIDTQFLPSATEEAVSWAEEETGRDLKLAIVLHPNPDKFNGTQALQARGVRVVTSREIAERVPAVHEKRKAWFFERYAPDYPDATPRPDVVAGGELTVAGITLTLHVLGPACSEAHLVVEHAGHLFVGDVVANGTHAWLELGLIGSWSARLGELVRLEPQHVHPGRGPSGGQDLIATQQEYLAAVGELTAAAVSESDHPAAPSEAELASLRSAILNRYPNLDYEVFLKLGLPAVWRQLADAAK